MSEAKVLEVIRCVVIGEDETVVAGWRALHCQNNPGGLEIPGGKRKAGESRLAAGVRETEKESGLRIAPTSEPVLVDGYPIQDGKYRGMDYRAYAFSAFIVGGTLGDTRSNEHLALAPHTRAELLGSPELTRVSRAALLHFQ